MTRLWLKTLLIAAVPACSIASACAQSTIEPPKTCREVIDRALLFSKILTHNPEALAKIPHLAEGMKAGITERMLVAEDYDHWKRDPHGGHNAFHWELCDHDRPLADAALPLSDADRALVAKYNPAPTPTQSTQPAQAKPQFRITVPPNLVDPPEGVPLPHYNVEANCQQRFPTMMNWCRNREQEAYDSLQAVWPVLHMGKATCIRLNYNAGNFYQGLEHCAMSVLPQQQIVDDNATSHPFHY